LRSQRASFQRQQNQVFVTIQLRFVGGKTVFRRKTMPEETAWTFAQKFIPEFYRNMGRFPTEQEIEEAERDWIDYLVKRGEPITDETGKVYYRFNERGEVVDAVVDDEGQR